MYTQAARKVSNMSDKELRTTVVKIGRSDFSEGQVINGVPAKVWCEMVFEETLKRECAQGM